MSVNFVNLLCLLLASLCFAKSVPLSGRFEKREDAASTDLPCLEIIAAAQQDIWIFAASDVFDCVQRVPFNAAVASRFLDYYNDTLQFQSTLKILEEPPEGYQRPPIDVMHQLEEIRSNVSSGAYKSQYAFELQLQLLVSRIHDSHVMLDAGVLSAFRFASPYTIVSVSKDGLEEPKVYLQEDLLAAIKDGYEASPVSKINDIDVVEYLNTLAAANSNGFVESHADWNSLMDNPAIHIQGSTSLLQSLTLYPGNQLNFTLANGTRIDTIWLALYTETSPTGPLTTPGDFYNYFVLGFIPDGFDPFEPSVWWPAEYNIIQDTDSGPEPAPTTEVDCSNHGVSAENWCNVTRGLVQAYPNDPVVVQNDFSITGSGSLSGYIFDDISTGVLSIPSFYQNDIQIKFFIDAVDDFIGNATQRGTKRVVIDLQQNDGGMVFLALITFQQFFPTIDPYTGSRMRSHTAADILGTAYSQWWRSLNTDSAEYNDYSASEWVILNRINEATGREFSSWSEYFGPILERGDSFSQRQLYNLSNELFDGNSFGWILDAWTDPSYVKPSPQWAPEDIVLLTDGLCSSACALFVELMTELAGVRTVAVGGLPARGPMQTASGNRGAATYSADDLDNDRKELKSVVQDEATYNQLAARNDPGMYSRYISINLRDQMRNGDSIPLQFRYDASDCRLYYTIQNAFNMSRLWRDAAAATWDSPSLCVPGSTGYSKTSNQNRKSPPRPAPEPPLSYKTPNESLVDEVDWISNTSSLLDISRDPNFNLLQRCNTRSDCGPKLICAKVKTSCHTGRFDGGEIFLCLESCNTLRDTNGCVKMTNRPVPSVQQQPGVQRRVATSIPAEKRAGGAPPAQGTKQFFAPQIINLIGKSTAPVEGLRSTIYYGYKDPGEIKISKYTKDSACDR